MVGNSRYPWPARVALICAVWALSSAAATAAPRVLVERDTVELGQVLRGETQSVEFVLRNEGSAPLRILSVDPGCDCTVTSFDEEIPPGGAGRVRATIDTSELQGPFGRGIAVYTNDPAREMVHLAVQAFIVSSVEIFPEERLKLSNVPTVASREGVLLVRQDVTEKGELSLDQVEASGRSLTVSAERLETGRSFEGLMPPGRPGDWVVTVSLENAAQEYGASTEQVTFRTGLPRRPEVVIPVTVVRRAPVNLSVERLSLEGPAGERTGSLVAIVRSGFTTDDLRVETEPPGLGVRLEPSSDRHVRVHVHWLPGDDPPDGRGMVTFVVGEERVRLPIDL